MDCWAASRSPAKDHCGAEEVGGIRKVLRHNAVMPRVVFPLVLQRHIQCAPIEVEGDTVRQALEHAFAHYPAVRSYLLDDAGALRAHVTIFVDGQVVRDRINLSTAVEACSRIDVLQALSGG
jgi:sulfur-carrier protein